MKEALGSRAQEIIERDKKVVSPVYGRAYEFVFDHGHGAEVWDADGKRYIDFMAGIGVLSTGHAHPDVVRAIQDQAEKGLHISSDFYHKGMAQLAERLNTIAPMWEDTTTFFTNSGTEAVEAAIKLAQIATGRHQFIAFDGSFNGRTTGALAFTASKTIQREGYTVMPGVTHVPYPDPYRPVLIAPENGDQGDAVVDYIENIVLKKSISPNDVAAILVEPIQGEGGYIVPAPHFFPRLRELCDKYGILLIVDEVQSGVGRTGLWWAIEHEGIEPDIVCSAKGIASGVPFGAMIARKSLSDAWKPGAHGNTYGGNPLGCAAALATLKLIKNEYIENAANMGKYMLEKLQDMQNRHPLIGDVRGRGLMIGVELVLDRTTKESAKEFRDALVQKCFENGLLILGCGESTIRFVPPLMIDKDLVDEGLNMFLLSLAQLEQESSPLAI